MLVSLCLEKFRDCFNTILTCVIRFCEKRDINVKTGIFINVELIFQGSLQILEIVLPSFQLLAMAKVTWTSTSMAGRELRDIIIQAKR